MQQTIRLFRQWGLLAAVLVMSIMVAVPTEVLAADTPAEIMSRGDSFGSDGAKLNTQSLDAASAYTVNKCGNTSSRVLLTYDDWAYGNSKRIVAQAKLLASKDVGATFFPIRQEYIKYLNSTGVNLATQVRDQGQWMGNHSWSHKNLTKLTKAGVTAEISKGAGGASGSSGYLRPPYGAYNASVKAIAEGMNYQVCTWTLDTLDYTGKTAAQICSHVKANAKAGSVVLMHLHTKAYDATNCIVDGLRAKGLQLCRPYKVDGKIATTRIRAPYPLPC